MRLEELETGLLRARLLFCFVLFDISYDLNFAFYYAATSFIALYFVHNDKNKTRYIVSYISIRFNIHYAFYIKMYFSNNKYWTRGLKTIPSYLAALINAILTRCDQNTHIHIPVWAQSAIVHFTKLWIKAYWATFRM